MLVCVDCIDGLSVCVEVNDATTVNVGEYALVGDFVDRPSV